MHLQIAIALFMVERAHSILGELPSAAHSCSISLALRVHHWYDR